MIPVAVFAAVFGYVASRSIVAVTDAHRLGWNDRWRSPICTFDATHSLNLLMTKCRQEGHRQRRSNVIVMISNMVLSVGMALVVPSLWLWPSYAVFVVAMVLLTVTDLDTMLIPNRMLGPLLASGFVLLAVGWLVDTDSGSMVRAILGALGYFAAMYLLALIARGGLGYGDVKLALLIGLFTAYLSWGALLVAGIGSFLVGGVVSLLLLASKARGRKDAIPFGPFMVVAGLTATIWGAAITDWYLG